MSATAPLFEPDPKSKPRKQPPLSAPVLLARLRTRYPKDAYAFMTEVPNGTVLQVVQSGYVIGDRVLRPALVGVSKGGPKAAANGAGAEAADSSSAAS